MNIILVGYGELASSLLLGVLESGHNLVGVLRWEKVEHKPLYLKIKDYVYPDSFYSLIKSYKIPEIKARSVNSKEFINEALKIQPDVILIGSWGEILKKESIILPKIACINCHPSLLPKHRGSNPYFSAIKTGEIKTGITFHLVDTGIDTGNILLQASIAISDDDTGQTLRTKCSYTAREMVKELLDGIKSGDLIPKPQNELMASSFPRMSEDDTILDWNKSVYELHNQIRGMQPWVPCYTRHKNEFFKIRTSKIIDLTEANQQKPGTVIGKGKNSLAIAVKENNKALLIENIELYGLFSKLCSRFYISKLVKIGDVLTDF